MEKENDRRMSFGNRRDDAAAPQMAYFTDGEIQWNKYID